MVSQRNRLERGSMPVDGSSIKTTAGFPTIAIAKLNFRRVPPEHAEAGLLACSFICNPAKKASTNLKDTKK